MTILNSPGRRMAAKAALGSALTAVGYIALHELGIDPFAHRSDGFFGAVTGGVANLDVPLLFGGALGLTVGLIQEFRHSK